MIFIDSNIVMDLLEVTGRWSDWSRTAMGGSGATTFALNAVVLAETAPRFPSSEEQLAYMEALAAAVLPITAAAAYLAGRAHQRYRHRGGPRQGIVADFLIGAHAAALRATLITRDRQRFATYFPDLPLITPETHP